MSTIKQLSIFLENKIGSLYEVMDVLSTANVRIIAATVADTTEYGILRIITSNPTKALEALAAANKNANISEVIALSCDSAAGAFYNKLRNFSQDGVIIEYMYCYSVSDRAFLIMRVNDNEKALAVAARNNIQTISNSELVTL